MFHLMMLANTAANGGFSISIDRIVSMVQEVVTVQNVMYMIAFLLPCPLLIYTFCALNLRKIKKQEGQDCE